MATNHSLLHCFLYSHSERKRNKQEDDVEVNEIDEVPDAYKQKTDRLLWSEGV
jgi:hypothetical protein